MTSLRLSGHLQAGIVAALVVLAAAAEGADSQLLVAAGAVVAWWGVIVVLVTRRLGGGQPPATPRAAIAAGGCLAGIAALSFLSIAWASDAGSAFALSVQAALYAGVFVLVVVLSSPGDGRSWLGGLAFGLAAVCAMALGARLLPGIEADAALVEAIPTAQGRLSFPLGYWNGLGALAAFALVLLAWLGAQGQTRLGRALATAAMVLPCLVLYLTFSRGAIVAAAGALLLLVALGPARARLVGSAAIALPAGGALVALAAARPDLRDGLPTTAADSQGVVLLIASVAALFLVGAVRYALDAPLDRLHIPRAVAAAAAGLGALVLAAGVAAADPGGWMEEFREPPPTEPAVVEGAVVAEHLASASGHGRWQFWGAALDAFREEPLRGLGAGGFEPYWNQHGTLSLAAENAHSVFLHHLAELGALGLLLLAGALGLGLVAALARRTVPGGAAGAAGAVVIAAALAFAIDWSWAIPAVALPVIVALGVVTGPATVPSPAPSAAGPATRRGRGIGLSAAIAVVAWVAIWTGGISLLTEIKLERSQAAAARGDLPDAATEAEDAVTLQPWAAEPRVQLGLVRELEGELATAREYLLQAVERAPEDWGAWLVLARVEAELANPRAAEAAHARAYALLPIDAEQRSE